MADPVTTSPVTTEFQNKLNSALRYGGSNAAMLFTVMGVFSILTPDQIVTLKAQIDVLQQSILTAYGALTKMGVILGPVAAIWLARIGWNSSTVQALAGKLLGIAKNEADPKKATEAQVAIVAAAADKVVVGETGGVVAKPEIAANPATPANVVAKPEELPKP